MDLGTLTWRMGSFLPGYLSDANKFGTIGYMDTILLLAERLHIYDLAHEVWIELDEPPRIAPGRDLVLDVTDLSSTV